MNREKEAERIAQMLALLLSQKLMLERHYKDNKEQIIKYTKIYDKLTLKKSDRK